MSKNKRFIKLVSVALVCVMVMVMCMGAASVNINAEDKAILLTKNVDGTYSKLTTRSIFRAEPIIKVQLVEDKVYKAINVEQYFIENSIGSYNPSAKHIFESNELNKVIESNLHLNTKSSLIEIINDDINSVVVYSMSNPYVGFAGMYYMDDVIVVEPKWTFHEVYNGAFSIFVARAFEVLVYGGVSLLPGGSFYVLANDLFGSSVAEPSSNISYVAHLGEYKTAIITYIKIDDVYQGGVKVEKSDINIKHYKVDINGFEIQANRNHSLVRKTNSYDFPDKLAYTMYGDTFVERITQIKYGGINFGSVYTG